MKLSVVCHLVWPLVFLALACNPNETRTEALGRMRATVSEPNEDLVCERGVGGDLDKQLCHDLAETLGKTLGREPEAFFIHDLGL